jgi:AraC-like DNA-binding protein
VLFEILVFVIQYLTPDATAEFIDGYVQFHGNIPGAVYWYGAAFALSGFLYPVYCLWLLRQHANTIRERFSYTEKISLNWLRLLILGALLSFIIGFVAFELIIGNSISEPRNAFYIIATVNTVFIFVLGYFGLRQPHIFVTRPEQAQQAKEKYMHSGLNEAESDRIIRDLKKFMKDERPFLDPKLTLAGLANQLGTSPNRLSQVLNSELGVTFYDFINDYRIEEVKQQLINPEKSHITLLGIALESGFNSKSSFNKLFKEKTGQTPSQFKKEMYKASGSE